MKKLYLLLIALVCAVCANADTTAVFDFAGNPWGHPIGSGTGESAAAGNVDQLTADDKETSITFTQGQASTPARFWFTSGANHVRCYGKSSVTITAPGVITKIKVTATTSGYLYVPSEFTATEGEQNSKEVELEGTYNIYTINIQGTAHTRWTRLEVTYDGEDGPATTDVTYTVKFGEQTLKTQTVTETVGEAPTFTLDAPAYVTVSGIPETIAEGTTAVTVETALNEQAPFAVGSTYNFYFKPNDNYYFWKDNGETDAREEFVTTNAVSYREAEAAKYEWTVGGDWMNGFTFVNANGNYINAPEGVAASSKAQLTAEATTKYVLVANGEKWHVAIKGNEGFFLAHVGHNGGNPYLQFWNVASYTGGDLYVKAAEAITATSTKTVTITFVTPSGDKYLLNNNEGTQNTIAYTKEAPASAQFEATLWSNGKYTYTNNGQYVGFRRMDSEFKANLNEWEVLSLEGVESSNITKTVPAGSVYLKVANRSGSDSQAGVMIVANADGSFANSNAPYFRDDFTSAILVEEYTEPTPEYVTSGKMALLNVKNQKYLGFNSNNIIANLDDQVEVSFAPFNETPGLYLLEVAGGKKDQSGVQKYLHIGSNARWSGSADTPTASNNTVRMYEIDDVKATEWHLTLATEGLVMGRNYMIVANCTKSGYEGDWGITGDVYEEGTANQRLNGYRFAETVEANNAAAWVATALPEPKPEGVTFEITDNENGTFTVTPSDNEATYFVHVTSDAINSAYEYADDAACFTGNVGYISESSEVHQGECTFTPSEWIEYWFGGRLTYNEGEYRIMVATVEGEITGATDNYTATQEPTIYTYTYAKPKPEFPVEDKAYVIKNVEAGLFLNVIEHDDKATILGAQPEKFFFTKKDGAWVIKNEEGRYVGGHATKDWNMSSSVEQLWKVVEVEGGYAFERADAAGKYIGFNNLTVDPDDATKTAAYRDKNYATAHGVFSIFEYTFPLQGEAYKVKNVDAGMYINLSNNAVKNTTLEKTAEKLFFTVAEEGGFYIQDEDGNYLGASEEGKSDYGWNTGNVKNLTWNVVEVEGGYAIQRVSNKAKHLGSDTVGEHGDLFTDKGISAHGVYLIMLFDTPETTPLEDLQAAIEAAKAIKAEDYATVPADLFEDLANEIEKAEALAAKGENAAVYEINEELAALEAAVKAITEYTEPTVDELTARLAAALTAANAAVAENYSEEVLMAGKPGYKAADLVVALEEAIATYTDFAGELTRNIVVEVEHAVRAYNEAEVCLPEVGKTYTIRNHTAGLRAEYGYYLSASNNILISSDGFTPGATEQWTVSEYDLLVEDDWGYPLFSEKRHVFTNKETGTMLGWNGSALGTCEGDPSNYTCWNYITTNPREHYADPSVKDMPYGTLGLQFYNGANYYRVATVWMRVDSLSFQGGDLHMHGLWSAYSSFYIFDEVDTNAVGVGTVMAPTAGSRIYNLQGQMQNSLRSGINIVGGQKVLK